MNHLNTVYLSIGSNLGNKLQNLQKAVDAIYIELGDVIEVSSVYETPPWGFSGNFFFNICIELQTVLSCNIVLEEVLKIEKKLGREEKTEKGYENRIIDIDILFFNDEVVFSEKLIIPHPRMLERNFVLIPLDEIASSFLHPVNKKSILHCLNTCKDKQKIKKIEERIIKPKLLKEKYSYIAIEGNIGAGKTSLAKMIAKDFNGKNILERFSANVFLDKFYKNKKRFAFHTELNFLTDRYLQLNEELRHFNLIKEFVISDYHTFKSLIFSRATLNKNEFFLYKKIFDIIFRQSVKPNLVVFLRQTPERLLENIKKRGREFEKDIDINYLNKINNAYLTSINSREKLNTKIIDISNLDFIENRIDYNLILKKIRK